MEADTFEHFVPVEVVAQAGEELTVRPRDICDAPAAANIMVIRTTKAERDVWIEVRDIFKTPVSDENNNGRIEEQTLTLTCRNDRWVCEMATNLAAHAKRAYGIATTQVKLARRNACYRLSDKLLDARFPSASPEAALATTPIVIDVAEPEVPDAKHDLCGTSHKLKGWKKSPDEMTDQELDDLIVNSVATCGTHVEKLNKEVRERLYPALLAMEKRFEKKRGARTDLKALKAEGWHEYLESRGVTPATFRKWKSRNAVKELEGYLLPPPEAKGKKTKKKGSSPEVDESESKVLAEAGLRLAKTMLNPLLTDAERAEKGQELSKQLISAAEGGVYELTVPEFQSEASARAPLQLLTARPTGSCLGGIWAEANAAGVDAAGKVTDEDVQASYRPVIVFFTNRQTVSVGKTLKAEGIEPIKMWGHTCYSIAAPAYRTFEEALAYAQACAAVLIAKELDICYGVIREDIWVSGNAAGWFSMKLGRCVTLACNNENGSAA